MTKKELTTEELNELKNIATSIAPSCNLTDEEFTKLVKTAETKKQMMWLRTMYTKYSGNPAGCWCKTGILTIIRWIKKLDYKNDTTGKNTTT